MPTEAQQSQCHPVPLHYGATCLAPLAPLASLARHRGLQVLPFAHSMGGVLMPWRFSVLLVKSAISFPLKLAS